MVHGDQTTTENYTYDAFGRLLTMTSSSGASLNNSYGNRSVTTTENGRVTTKTYDAWGNVTASGDPISSVNYFYHSNGQPSAVISEGAMVSMGYDTAGNQTSLDDPDAGTTTYSYDALHRVTSQTDARGYETSFVYDGAGRVTSKNVNGGSTSYTYNAGRLSLEQNLNGSVSYTYDDWGRLSQETRSMNGESPITFGYHYDRYGRLSSKDYPQNVSVSYVYDDHYSGQRIASQMGNRNIWLLSEDNGLQTTTELGGTLAFGLRELVLPGLPPQNMTLSHDEPFYPPEPIDTQHIDPIEPYPYIEEWPVYYTTGNDMVLQAVHDSRGYLTRIDMLRNDNIIHRMTYNFEGSTGNLLSRSGMCSLPEAFAYDDLDRLTGMTMGGVTRSVSYHANGNISSKTNLGSFYYGSSHPHAVTEVGSQGNIPTASQMATYSPFGKVTTLSEDGYTMTFTYGPGEQRWKTILQHNGATVRTTLYAGDYERITEDGTTRHIYYLDHGVIYVLEDGDTESEFYYTYTDHLGSITRIYNETGTTVFSAEYDAWGSQTVHQTNGGFTFHRGYTGHEMLPEFGLINMNGRLYDPILGRFLSPDNYVQMPDFSQSFNRYSYCLNNPLKYTDPSGEFWWLAAAMFGGVINVAMNIDNIDNGWDFLGFFGVGVAAGALGGAVGNAVAGAIGIGGFAGGAISGLAGGFSSGFVLGGGNSVVTNGSFEGFFQSAVTGALIGGMTGAVIGGVAGGYSAYKQGNNFWTGKPNSIAPQVELDYEQMDNLAPKLPIENKQISLTSSTNGVEYKLNSNFKISHSKYLTDSKYIYIKRPQIKGYANRVWSSEKFHNFPRSMDKQIVEEGLFFSNNGSTGFIYPGYVDKTMGFYNITMDAFGIIKHRMFYPMDKAHQIWVGSKDFRFFFR